MTAISEDNAALDSVLRHHLSLDPATKEDQIVADKTSQNDNNAKKLKLTKRVSLKEFTDLPIGL